MINARSIMLGIMTIVILAMGSNFFMVDLASNTGDTVDSLNMTVFNQTREVIGYTEEIKNETGFLENVLIIGDIVALMGNAVRGLKILYSIPGLLMNMVFNGFSLMNVPMWIYDAISAVVWIVVIFMVVYFMRGYRN